MRFGSGLVAAYSIGLLAQFLQHVLAAQRDGVFAILQVGAPHLYLPLLLLVPLGVLSRRPKVLAVVLIAALLGVARFGPSMFALPAPALPGAVTINVASWNLAAGDASAAALVERLLASDAQIVALSELTPAHSVALEASAEIRAQFPHRLLAPHSGVLGMGLLSAHSAREIQRSADPPHILAEIELPDGRPIVTMSVHPLPARFSVAGGLLPVGYFAGDRDHDLAHLRSMLEHHLAAGRPVLVLGDLNVTDRELAYAYFVAGLTDAHRQVGLGPGSTWRPARLAALPFGVLRIDYVLTGVPLRPIAIATECDASTGDHCIVWATIALE
ncbi:hypothetical protein BH23CHL7_BH23CHL7_01280 [soil metagenome]